MKKEEVYVKLTDKNREKVFKILDMFGQKLTKEDELARKTGRYPNGTSIKDFPELEFKIGGTWMLYQGYPGNTKTRIKTRQLRNMLAQEHLKEGDVVVVDNGWGRWVLELTGNNMDMFEHHRRYSLGLNMLAANSGRVDWVTDGNFIRYATEEERKLLQPVVFECASCERELDVEQRSDDKPNLCNNCFNHAIISFEPKTTDGKKLARYGDVCKFYNINPGVFVVGYLAYFGKAHDKKVYYCVGLDSPFYNAEPITKEEAIKILFKKIN